MFIGYMALGGDTFDSTRFELVNTNRALAYVEGWNAKILAARYDPDAPAPTACIDWLHSCDECATAASFFSDGEGYLFPETDTAPWYDPSIKDSEKFLGVIGLEVKGDEDSTRSAEVTQSIGGGGVVGRLRYAPRTFVVRALAVAADGCGMEVGLNWLREQYKGVDNNCEGDHLWVLDCCPECVGDENAPPVGPCWADTYAELSSTGAGTGVIDIDGGTAATVSFDGDLDGGAAATVVFDTDLDGEAAGSAVGVNEVDGGTASTVIFDDDMDGGTAATVVFDLDVDGGTAASLYTTTECAAPDDCPPGVWWPCTYAELRDGPPDLDPLSSGWCAWLQFYRDLRRGLPEFSCSVGSCVDPYVRNYRNVRVTDGPTILSRRVMSRMGEIAEIEFTIVAADPAEYSPYVSLLALEIVPVLTVDDDEPAALMMKSLTGAADEPAAAVLRPKRVEPVEDVFARGHAPRAERRTRLVETPTRWARHEFSVDPVRTTKMTKFVPRVTLTAIDGTAGAVRVGLWRDGELLDGFTVPFIPEGGSVQIDGRAHQTVTEHDGYVQTRSGFAVGFDGGVRTWPELSFSEAGLRVSVDQEVGKEIALVAEVAMSEKGSG